MVTLVCLATAKITKRADTDGDASPKFVPCPQSLADSNNQKTKEFFKRSGGLHSYFERKNGSLMDAIANANCSMKDKQADRRNYTYSELGCLLERLSELQH